MFAKSSQKRLFLIDELELFDKFRRKHDAMMMYKKVELLWNWIV